MDDTSSPAWTIAEHLSASSTAIAEIEADPTHVVPAPVCHHFIEIAPVDPMKVSVEGTYRHLVPLFAKAGVEFLPDRLEAWETARPGREWLHRRLPALLDGAKLAGFEYLGWTWEPHGRQPIGSSEVRVINNRTT